MIRQNTFSGNDGYGLAITGEAYNNTSSPRRSAPTSRQPALGNGAGGVLLSSTGGGNVIGTPQISSTPSPSPSDQYNIISGNDGNGITLGPDANRDSIVNNWIGLNIKGLLVLPNTGVAIQDDGTSNLIYGNAGVVIVGSGQSATGLVVTAPTTLEVYSGGTVNQTTISAGAMEVVSVNGTSNNTTVMRDGVLQLLGASAGGAVLGGTTTIQDGGALKAFGLGIASGAALSQQGGSTMATAAVDNGTITVARGTFDAATLSVGTTAKGTFNQNGGSVTIGGKLAIAGSAGSAYTLTGGMLTSASLAVATGTKFAQSGGTATFSDGMSTSGAITLASGILTTTKLGLAVGGAFEQSGGTATVSGAIANNGAMTLASGIFGAASLSVGTTAQGAFSQSGGAATIAGKLAIAGATGTAGSAYTLKSGMLTAATLVVAADGRFAQSGGVATFTGAVGDNGTMTLTHGIFNAASLGVGTTAAGTFTQSGGTATIMDKLAVGGTAGSLYSLKSGDLTADGLSIAGGGRFSQTGGAATFLGTVLDNYSMTLAAGTFSAASLGIGTTAQAAFTQTGGEAAIAGSLAVAGAAAGSYYNQKSGILAAENLSVASGTKFLQRRRQRGVLRRHRGQRRHECRQWQPGRPGVECRRHQQGHVHAKRRDRRGRWGDHHRQQWNQRRRQRPLLEGRRAGRGQPCDRRRRQLLADRRHGDDRRRRDQRRLARRHRRHAVRRRRSLRHRHRVARRGDTACRRRGFNGAVPEVRLECRERARTRRRQHVPWHCCRDEQRRCHRSAGLLVRPYQHPERERNGCRQDLHGRQLTDGLQTAIFALYNQTANQYGLSTSDYTLKSDGHSTSGTLFELAPGH